MGVQNNRPKKTVWQDIVPASSLPKTPVKKKRWQKTRLFFTTLAKFFKNPSFTKLRKRFLKVPKRRKVALFGLLMIILVAGAGFYIKTNFIDVKVDPNKVTIQEMAAKKPEYTTILPSGKTIKDLGGWKRVSPTDRSAVFAYIDTIDSVQINVSEQPLPNEFKEDVATQIEQLAKGFKADEKITVGSTIVYIGTSIKGPQSVILTKNSLLILIKSSAKIDSKSWATYINTLQ